MEKLASSRLGDRASSSVAAHWGLLQVAKIRTTVAMAYASKAHVAERTVMFVRTVANAATAGNATLYP